MSDDRIYNRRLFNNGRYYSIKKGEKTVEKKKKKSIK